MHSFTAFTARYQDAACPFAQLARSFALVDDVVVTLELSFIYLPVVVKQEAKVVSIVVWRCIVDSDDHKSLFPWSLANVAKSSFALLFIRSSTEAATVASLLYSLAVQVDAHGALGAIEDRVA